MKNFTSVTSKPSVEYAVGRSGNFRIRRQSRKKPLRVICLELEPYTSQLHDRGKQSDLGRGYHRQRAGV